MKPAHRRQLRDMDARFIAVERGRARYFTGNPCPKGHQAERYVSSGYCVACQEAANKARDRKVRRTQ